MKLWLGLSFMADLAFAELVSAAVLFDKAILKLHRNIITAKILYNSSIQAAVRFCRTPHIGLQFWLDSRAT